MPTPVPTMTATPPFPSLADRAAGTYNSKAYAFGVHMAETFNGELVAVAQNVHGNAVEAAASATAAAEAKTSAQAAAAAAAAITNAPKWVAGTVYADGVCVWSPTDYTTYRRKAPGGVSNTDPAADNAGWAPAGVTVFVDTNPIIKGSEDPTKRVRFEVDGLTAGVVRTITVPDKNITLVSVGDWLGANTYTGKQSAPVFIDGIVVNAAASGAINLDVSVADVFDLTLSGNVTSSTFVNVPELAATEELTVVVRVTQGATSYTFAYPTTAAWLTSGGAAPAAPAANKTIEYVFTKRGSNGWIGRKGAAN